MQRFKNPGGERRAWGVERGGKREEGRGNYQREPLNPGTPEPGTFEPRTFEPGTHKAFIFAVSLLIFTGLNLPVKAFAQVRAGAAYLKILPGTRQQGVSGSMTAGLDESFSIYSNPGATGLLREWQFAMSYTKWIAGINNSSLFAAKRFDFSTPFGRHLTAGLGLNSQWVDIQSTNGLAPAASARDLLLTGTIGIPLDKVLENLSLGANIKYLNSNLDISSVSSLLFDVGLIYRTRRFNFPLLPFDGIFSVGGSVNHLGKSLKFQKLETPLPRIYRLGAGLNLGAHNGLQFQLVGDFRRVRDEVDQYGIGLEVMNVLNIIPVMNKMGGRFLSVRLGWLQSNGQDKNILNDLSLGFSLNFDDFMNYRAKSGNGGFAATNTAWRFDMTNQSNVSVSGDVSHFGGVLFPNGPEAFEFVIDKKFMTTDTTDAYFDYDLGDKVELIWQASHDPDLYDNANYVILVSKDRPVLAEMLAASIFQNPQGVVDTVFYHPATTGKNKPAQMHGGTIEKNENHISCATINSAKVELFYFFPHQIKAEKFVELSNFVGPKPVLKPDSTFTFSKKDNQFKYFYRPAWENCNYSNDYYWSVIAYDKNFHQRIVSGEKSNIAHFKVVGKPDLTININRIDSVSSPLPETFSLEDVNFVFNKADTSDLYPASKDSLEKRVERLNQVNYDSILVYGYTDSIGSAAVNQKLSQDRAESIVTYLKRHGVRSGNYVAFGFGEKELLEQTPGESPLDWNKRNRRVRMRVVKEPPPKQYFARLDITNVGQVKSPAGFTLNVFDKTDNLTGPLASTGRITQQSVDIVGGANGTPALRIPFYTGPGLNVHPDSSNFRFDKLSAIQVVPDTTFQISGISCGETISFVTIWNEQNRFLVAVVDQLNKVEEVNEQNNWDIEQLLATDLEIKEKHGKVAPIGIPANFDYVGSHILTQSAQQSLLNAPHLDDLKLALGSSKFPNTYLEIGGHTDDQGSGAINNPLSLRRAKWVKNFLVTKLQFDSTRVAAVGFGATRPLHDSVSVKHTKYSPLWKSKQKDNRRIEIRWLENATGIAPPDRICTTKNCRPNDPQVRAAFIGQEVEYTLKVNNLSDNAATSAEVIDVLPQYFKFKNGSEKRPAKALFTTQSNKLKWILDIPGQGSATLKYTVILDKSFGNRIEDLTNNVSVSSPLDYNPRNNRKSDTITGIGNSTPKVTTHEVQCGEYLSTIALMYYDNTEWDTIYSENKKLISDPDIIQPGLKLKIPNVKATSVDSKDVFVDISGTTKVGSELRAYLKFTKTNKNVPANVRYRWLREGVVIDTCAAYKIQPGDANKKLTLEIIDLKTGLVFNKTIQVPALPAGANKPPVVTIKGGCVVGDTLTATFEPDLQGEEGKFNYIWLRGGAPIPNSKGKIEYKIVEADKNALITLEITPNDGNTTGQPIRSNEFFVPPKKMYTEPCEKYTKPVSISQNQEKYL